MDCPTKGQCRKAPRTHERVGRFAQPIVKQINCVNVRNPYSRRRSNEATLQFPGQHGDLYSGQYRNARRAHARVGRS
eukprot:9500163-Pyramimonas_sp.AAC.1